MAKKRKTSRKPAPRKKKTATKKARPAKPTAAKPSVEMKGTRMNLIPLKALMKLHLDRLKSAKVQGGKVQLAIDTLSRSLNELNEDCVPTMELELG